MGELTYRIGGKDQLIAELASSEKAAWQAEDQRWLEELSDVSTFDESELPALISAYLDHLGTERRLASIVRYEMLIEDEWHGTIADQKAAWFDQGLDFWTNLLRGRHDHATSLARAIHAYVTAEEIFTLALGSDPVYRMARDICVHRLCNGIVRRGDGSGDQLFQVLYQRDRALSTAARARNERAAATAEAAGTLMMERGVAAVNHRSVGQRMGLTGSAAAYHYPSRPELIEAAVEAVHEKARHARESTIRIAEDGSISVDEEAHNAISDHLSRAMVILGLAATRDRSFGPLSRHLRIDRGRHTFRDVGIGAAPKGFDRWSAQVSSMAMLGASINAMSLPGAIPGHRNTVLADVRSLTD